MRLLPSGEEVAKIVRYETALERQFEREVQQQLVAWRRERGRTLTERDMNPEGKERPQAAGLNGEEDNQEIESITDSWPFIGYCYILYHLYLCIVLLIETA